MTRSMLLSCYYIILMVISWWCCSCCYLAQATSTYGDHHHHHRSSSSLSNLSNWAKQHGTVLHPAVQWVDYGNGDWGLQLTSKVDRGTELIRVPRSIVLDSVVIKDELLSSSTTTSGGIDNATNECIIDALGAFQVHEENFWIVLKLYHCLREGKHAPWIDAMPRKFRHFSREEEDCLPFYAKYIVDYQRQKLDAFIKAASIICGHELDRNEKEQFTWAFDAVGSRFWKTTSSINKEDYQPRSELVPIGDMFNHREPPNVKLYHDNEGDAVCFLYLGEEGEEDNLTCYPKDLLITYGLHYNPHRFLVIFGFVPTDMKEIWSHFVFSDNNPYSSDISKMVFQCKDGFIPQDVWDAVFYELDPSKDMEVMRHDPMAKFYASEVLNNHVTKELDELAKLREKMASIEGETLDLIKMHNQFLTDVFRRVQVNLKAELGKQ